MTYSAKVGDFLIEFAGPAGVGGTFPTGWASWTPPTFPGTIVFCWDNVGHALYVYEWSSTTWKAGGGGGGSSFNPFSAAAPVAPAASTLTLTQSASLSSTATKADLASGRGVQLKVPVAGDNTMYQATLGVAGPSSSSMTLKAFLHKNYLGAQPDDTLGLYLKDSAGKLLTIGFALGASGLARFEILPWSVIGTRGSAVISSNLAEWEMVNTPFWLKTVITGGNLVSSISFDGEQYSQIDTRSVASLSTVYNATLSECGFHQACNNTISSNPPDRATRYLNCYEFDCTTP